MSACCFQRLRWSPECPFAVCDTGLSTVSTVPMILAEWWRSNGFLCPPAWLYLITPWWISPLSSALRYPWLGVGKQPNMQSKKSNFTMGSLIVLQFSFQSSSFVKLNSVLTTQPTSLSNEFLWMSPRVLDLTTLADYVIVLMRWKLVFNLIPT